MKLNPNHIFIDTNVLNGVYLNKTADNDKHFTTFLNINALKSSEVRSIKK